MKKGVITFNFILLFLWLNAQFDNCANASFEFGTREGYRTYLGSIDGRGNVVIQDPRADDDRHKIMHITDGHDPIAARYCELNKILPVVPPEGGQYAMRLGNSKNGAQAERVVLQFAVTPELTFFLLRYAVILDDPRHEAFEQPRFELRILDEAGDVFPCGEYKVRAAENIPGFEQCGSWRIRPWTTAGFELQSFLGQTIQIEILTTDCSRGGHAGYAYFDATCKPLEIQLEGYCPGNTSARMRVTDGFVKYKWNTGDTTNTINIINPIPGTAYAVTVTSATGCTLTLTETLPTLQELPAPKFHFLPDTTICLSNRLWVHPTGEHLNEVFSPDLGFSADSFLLAPINTTTYTFVSTDKYGCRSDSFDFTIHVDTLSTIISVYSVDIDSTSCFDAADGRIQIETDAHSILWSNSSTSNTILGLEAGTYTTTLTDEFGCRISRSYSVRAPPELKLDRFEVEAVRCYGEANGAIRLFPSGGNGPYRFNNGEETSLQFSMSELPSGSYDFMVTDQRRCVIEKNIFVPQPEKLKTAITQDSVSCAEGKDGAAIVNITGGTTPYIANWDDPDRQQTPRAINLIKGLYRVRVTDINGCMAADSIMVEEPTPLLIDLITQDSASCHAAADGRARVFPSGGTPGYAYVWNDVGSQTGRVASGLTAGVFSVIVQDRKGCTVSEQVEVLAPPPIVLTFAQDSVTCNRGQDGMASVAAAGGNGGFQYHWPEISWEGPNSDNLPAGVYKAVVTDRKNCRQMGTVAVKEPPPIIIRTTRQFFPNCREGKPGITIVAAEGGSGGFQYLWETGGATDTIKSFEPGFFDLAVVDRKGCRQPGEAEIKGLQVDILAAGPFVNQYQAICNGDELKLSAKANQAIETFNWYSSETLPCKNCSGFSLSPIDSAYYQVNVIDINGCKDTASLFIPLNRFQLSIDVASNFLDNGRTVCYGEELRLSAISHPEIAVLKWQADQAFSCDDCLETIVRPSDSDRYIVKAKAVNGCSSQAEKLVVVNKIACEQFIPNAFSPNGDGLNDVFYIPSSKAAQRVLYLQIFVKWGNLVFEIQNC